MNKVSLISLNLNEIFIEENEVSSLLCMTKCPCWFPRADSLGPVLDHEDGEQDRDTHKLTQHEQCPDCSDQEKLMQSSIESEIEKGI